jgi:hypothetical protein
MSGLSPKGVLPFAAACFLGGCASAPLSFLDGTPSSVRMPQDHYTVRVISVDGNIQFKNPVQLAPGPRWLVLEAVPGKSAVQVKQKRFALKVEPCTHYYLLAYRKSPMDSDWELVVQATEPVQRCIPEEELKKS